MVAKQQTKVEQGRRRVAEAVERIAWWQGHIDTLRRDGHDTTVAINTLRRFVGLLDQMKIHLAFLEISGRKTTQQD